ncbi:MAG: Sec-independent protein translocase protein TatB [Caulobacteraceae bacterium]
MFPEGRIVEFMIVGAVALVVVGPKDLPLLMRKVGAFLARMRAMAAEFRASFDEIARQSELDELRREVEAMRAGVSLPGAVGAVAGPEARQVFQDIHTGLNETSAHLDETQQDLPFGAPSEPAKLPEETVPPVKAET